MEENFDIDSLSSFDNINSKTYKLIIHKYISETDLSKEYKIEE